MLQVEQHRENLIRTRLPTSEKGALIKRGSAALFCGRCHHLANCRRGHPAELCRSQVHKKKCLTSFGLAKLNLCPGKLPNRGLNKREIHFNSCHFGGLQSSQGSCRALKAVVTLREAGSWGCRMCVCMCARVHGGGWG